MPDNYAHKLSVYCGTLFVYCDTRVDVNTENHVVDWDTDPVLSLVNYTCCKQDPVIIVY